MKEFVLVRADAHLWAHGCVLKSFDCPAILGEVCVRLDLNCCFGFITKETSQTKDITLATYYICCEVQRIEFVVIRVEPTRDRA